MSLNKITLFVVLAAGIAGCANAPPPMQSPAVVQGAGVSSTGQSITGGAAAAPPGVGNINTTHSY